MNAARGTVLVLGGGLIGLSVANYLLTAGYKVVVIDRHEPGSGASYGNAGLIANFATLPMASRRTLTALPKQLLKRNTGVSVRANYWYRMFPFARHFLRSSQPEAYVRNRTVLSSLISEGCRELRRAAELFSARDLIAERGALLVYQNPDAWARVHEDEVPQRQELGVACQVLNGHDLGAIEPALENVPMVGGILYPDTCHIVDPGALCRRLLERFLECGGRFERASLRHMERASGGGVRMHSTAGTSYSGEKAVVALGANTVDVLKASHWALPLVSERGYHIVIDPPNASPQRPIGWGDHHFFLTPMADGLRVAGTTEFARPSARPDSKRFRLLEFWAERLLSERVNVRSRWVGSRATTPDGLPLIGTLPECEDVILATGHGHVGLTLSALTGRLVTDLLNGREDQQVAMPLRPSRFAFAR